jgi:nitric oxide reductase activation protein
MVLMVIALPGTLSGGQLGAGQRTQPSDPFGDQAPTTPPHTGGVPDFGSPTSPRAEEQQARIRSTERQKKLVADTDKLLALATELKTDVDKTNKDILSVDVIKKADEIEKLAHSVKERMKG